MEVKIIKGPNYEKLEKRAHKLLYEIIKKKVEEDQDAAKIAGMTYDEYLEAKKMQ